MCPKTPKGSAPKVALLAHDSLPRIEAVFAGNPGIAALVLTAQRNSELLECILAEARAVLDGNVAARDRVWLLLHSAAGMTAAAIPQHILEPLRDEPTLIQADALLDLVSGVGRSANSPADAVAMVTALGALLDSLFLLEHAVRAQDRGDLETVRTIAAAGHATSWHDQNKCPVPNASSTPWEVRSAPGWVPVGTIVGKATEGWNWEWDCLALGSSEIDPFGGSYEIVSVSDRSACGGETITISGFGFGDEGLVFFPSPRPDDPVLDKFIFGTPGLNEGVPAVSWTNNQVDVIVPRWAVSGALRLNVFQTVKNRCRERKIYKLGNSFTFTGGLASIFEVSVDDQAVDLDHPQLRTYAPNTSVKLSWSASVGPGVRVSVSIQRKSDEKELWRARPDFSGGSHLTYVPIPVPDQPTLARFVLSATGKCGNTMPLMVDFVINVVPKLRVDFIEVTQGVQTDAVTQGTVSPGVEGRLPSGFVMPLVEGKDTGVRIHVSCDRRGWFRDQLRKVTGRLWVHGGTPDGIVLAPLNRRPVVPDAGFIDVEVRSRETDDFTTLNFLIPGPACVGTRTISIHLYSASDLSGPVSAQASIQWKWEANRPIRLRWIALNPSASALHTLFPYLDQYLRDALHYLPSTVYDVGPAWKTVYTHDYDLTIKEGERQEDAVERWHELLDDLSSFKDCTAWDDVNPFADHCSSADDGATWVGIVPWDGEQKLPVLGDADTPGDTCIAVTGRPEVVAHEIGHTRGLEHVDLTAQGNSIEGPYRKVDNGGYHRRPAFDVHAGKVLMRSPAAVDNHGVTNNMAADLMTNFHPIWLTTTNWLNMFVK